MMDQQPSARETRDAETSAGRARTELFRALDRALDEVRAGLVVDAWGSRASAPRRRNATRIAPNE